MSFRVSCFGEELPGLFEVCGDVGRGLITAGIGRRDAVGGEAATLQHGSSEQFTINGERKGAAHTDIIERCTRDIEAEEVGLKERIDP